MIPRQGTKILYALWHGWWERGQGSHLIKKKKRIWAIRDFPVHGNNLQEQGHAIMIVGFPFSIVSFLYVVPLSLLQLINQHAIASALN